jgi:ribose transport system substrate-binding protein
MRSVLRALIVVFGLLSLGTFLGSFFLARRLYIPSPGEGAPSQNYHFSLYLPDNRNSFFTGIIRGAEQAAAEMDATVSIHSIDSVKNELEMAAYTGWMGLLSVPIWKTEWRGVTSTGWGCGKFRW